MNRIVLLFFALVNVPCAAQEGRLVTEKLESKSLRHNLIGVDPTRSVLVYLPPSYATGSKRYPVLYLLHSWGENNHAWLDSQHSQGLNIAKSMDSLIHKAAINDMIIVAPDCSNRLGGSWYVNSSSGGNWEEFLINDLIEFVDKKYRTVSSPAYRGVAGHSMGGYGALRIGLSNTDRFGSIYAMSSINLIEDKIARLKYPDLLKQLKRNTPIDSLDMFSKLLLSKSVAFVPGNHPPYYCNMLFRERENEVIPDTAVMKIWNSELLINKLSTYRETQNSPIKIVMDHGSQDFLVNESRRFSAELLKFGFKVDYMEYDGDHTNQFRDRIENYVLPHFSNFFTSDTIKK